MQSVVLSKRNRQMIIFLLKLKRVITAHANFNELGGQMHLDKISALQWSLESQQATFTRPWTETMLFRQVV